MAKSPKRKVGWSPTAITVALSLTLMVLTWAAAASAFATARFQADIAAEEAAGEDPPDVDYLKRPRLRRASGLASGVLMVWTFVKNAFVEIPHAPQVIWFALTQRILIPIGWMVGEGLIINQEAQASCAWHCRREADRRLNSRDPFAAKPARCAEWSEPGGLPPPMRRQGGVHAAVCIGRTMLARAEPDGCFGGFCRSTRNSDAKHTRQHGGSV